MSGGKNSSVQNSTWIFANPASIRNQTLKFFPLGRLPLYRPVTNSATL